MSNYSTIWTAAPQSYDTSLKLVSKDCLGVSSDQLFQEHPTSISKKQFKR